MAGAFALCNAAECLLAAGLIERFFGPAFNLDSLRQVIGFIAVSAAAVAPCALAAAMVIHADWPANSVVMPTAVTWFLSDTLGSSLSRRFYFGAVVFPFAAIGQ